MAGHHDPKLLYAINNIAAYHIMNGEETPLTPSGPQTMSLLMVPTNSPFADLSTSLPQNEAPEEDFYLHLHLPPELDLPLPATTQIYHQPPRSYLIPRWDLGPDSGTFTRIEFPTKINQEDVDTFETILAQCTSFLERAPPPTGDKTHKPYNPAEWQAGGSMGGGKTAPGQLVLVDEDDGSIVGELVDGAKIEEDPRLSHGTKTPVEIEVSPDGSHVSVRPVSDDYLRMASHPAYRSSSMVQNAAAASRLIVTTSTYVGNMLSSGADKFQQNSKPREKPLIFSPASHDKARRVHTFTQKTATLSSKTVGQVTKYAQNVGASMARRGKARGDKSVSNDYKPGLLNKSMIAFSTIADGIAESGRTLLTQGGAAATQVVQHKYGPDAGKMAGTIAGGVKNVGLVYIDVTGVSRRAVIKSVAKGMVVGRVKDGGEVIVGGGDGGAIPPEDFARYTGGGVENNLSGAPTGIETGFGNAAGGPPPYQSELGEPMGSTGIKEKNTQI